MSGMAWAAITAGHWGFFGLGMLFTSVVGLFALGLAAAAKKQPPQSTIHVDLKNADTQAIVDRFKAIGDAALRAARERGDQQ